MESLTCVARQRMKSRVKKVRVCYADPDATESESEDEDDNLTNNVVGSKRVIHEIILVPGKDSKLQYSSKKIKYAKGKKGEVKVKTLEKINNVDQIVGQKKVRVASSKYKGVRRRKSGRYSAEIRNPFTRKRDYLGTFDTEEEAARAIVVKELEFDPSRVMDDDYCRNMLVLFDVSAIEKFKFTLLGEVKKVGSCTVFMDRVTDQAKKIEFDREFRVMDDCNELTLSGNLKVDKLESSVVCVDGARDLKTLGYGGSELEIFNDEDWFFDPNMMSRDDLVGLNLEGEDLELGIFHDEGQFYDPNMSPLEDLVEYDGEMFSWADSLLA